MTIVDVNSARRRWGGSTSVVGSQHDLALGKVAAAVLQRIPATGRVVLGIVSVEETPETSRLGTALARLLSQHLDDDVLLVETDLRRASRIAAAFGLPPRPGLEDLIAAPDLATARIGHRVDAGLLVVPCGSSAASLETLPDRPLSTVLDHVAAHTPTTVLLCPPLAESPDGRVVASTCDLLVLVVGQGRTSRAALAEVVEDLGQERFVGAVFQSEPPRRGVRRRGRT